MRLELWKSARQVITPYISLRQTAIAHMDYTHAVNTCICK